MRPYAVLMWLLYGAVVWCVVEMAVTPERRFQFAAAGALVLVAIALTKEEGR